MAESKNSFEYDLSDGELAALSVSNVQAATTAKQTIAISQSLIKKHDSDSAAHEDIRQLIPGRASETEYGTVVLDPTLESGLPAAVPPSSAIKDYILKLLESYSANSVIENFKCPVIQVGEDGYFTWNVNLSRKYSHVPVIQLATSGGKIVTFDEDVTFFSNRNPQIVSVKIKANGKSSLSAGEYELSVLGTTEDSPTILVEKIVSESYSSPALSSNDLIAWNVPLVNSYDFTPVVVLYDETNNVVFADVSIDPDSNSITIKNNKTTLDKGELTVVVIGQVSEYVDSPLPEESNGHVFETFDVPELTSKTGDTFTYTKRLNANYIDNPVIQVYEYKDSSVDKVEANVEFVTKGTYSEVVLNVWSEKSSIPANTYCVLVLGKKDPASAASSDNKIVVATKLNSQTEVTEDHGQRYFETVFDFSTYDLDGAPIIQVFDAKTNALVGAAVNYATSGDSKGHVVVTVNDFYDSGDSLAADLYKVVIIGKQAKTVTTTI